MYTVDGLKKLVSQPLAEIEADINKLHRLAAYYKHIFGLEGCLGCGRDFKQIYSRLKHEGLSIMETTKNSSFALRKGVNQLPVKFGSNKYVTPTNLTDELAIEHLSNNKKAIKFYEKYPADWEDLVEASRGQTRRVQTEKATKKPAEAGDAAGQKYDGMSVSELKAEAELLEIDLGGATKKKDIIAKLKEADEAAGPQE